MRKKAENSIIILTAVFFICFTLVSFRYFNLASESPYLETAMSNSFITINADPCQGTIYDRNMNPLTNRKYYFQAVIVPDFVNYDEIAEYAQDREYFDKKFNYLYKILQNIITRFGFIVENFILILSGH